MDEDIFDMDAVRKAGSIKSRLKARGLTAGKCTCPHCGTKAAAVARLAGPRDHLHIRCGECGWTVME